VYGPGDSPKVDATQLIIAGGASGAKTAPLTGLPTVYGQSQSAYAAGLPGVVIIRLTAE
jgi:hypothetical protein